MLPAWAMNWLRPVLPVFFVLPDDKQHFRQFFFLAAGSGVTLVYPLIKTLLYANAVVNVVPIYSNRPVSTTIFYEELVQLHALYTGRFFIKWLFS